MPDSDPIDRAIADSGDRTTYDSGAQRDSPSGKGSPHLVSPFALRRLWAHLEKGGVKYSPRNWEQGIAFSRFFDGIVRHLHQWWLRETDEDHLAAALWGVHCLMHGEEMIRRWLWDPNLDDRPDYSPPDAKAPDHFADTIVDSKESPGDAEGT